MFYPFALNPKLGYISSETAPELRRRLFKAFAKSDNLAFFGNLRLSGAGLMTAERKWYHKDIQQPTVVKIFYSPRNHGQSL
jgi:hypothetical protein